MGKDVVADDEQGKPTLRECKMMVGAKRCVCMPTVDNEREIIIFASGGVEGEKVVYLLRSISGEFAMMFCARLD